jgi:hypothetical protein
VVVPQGAACSAESLVVNTWECQPLLQHRLTGGLVACQCLYFLLHLLLTETFW